MPSTTEGPKVKTTTHITQTTRPVQDNDDEDLLNLKHTATEEVQRPYQERFHELTSNGNGRHHSNGLNHSLSQPQADDESESFQYGTPEDNEEEEEFVYDGKDVKVFDDEDVLEGDYGTRLDAILEFDQNLDDNDKSKLEVETNKKLDSHPVLTLSPTSHPPIHLPNNNVAQHSRCLTPAQSVTGSATSSNLFFLTTRPRPSSAQFSRLRSLVPTSDRSSPALLTPPPRRSTSTSTFASDSPFEPPSAYRPSPLPLSPVSDLISHASSTTNLYELNQRSSTTPSLADESFTTKQEILQTGLFRWASLKRISQKIYPSPKRHHPNNAPSAANTLLGLPTVIAASGVIVIGTGKGWTMVFDYASNLKCVLGTDLIVRDAGAVSALSISHDHTFVAVGHVKGHIYLYDLSKPHTPARIVLPTTMRLVQAGRAEGHLSGQRIIHLGFVGLRHTAVVSADESGLAFYHHLGQVLGLASNDTIRILGKYPDSTPPPPALSDPTGHVTGVDATRRRAAHMRISSDQSLASASGGPVSRGSRRPNQIFGCTPLPLGPSPHATDAHSLVALLTPAKLIIVGLKPSARTWWRSMREVLAPEEIDAGGSLCWFPSTPTPTPDRTQKPHAMDPLLAFAWGRQIRFVTVMSGARQAEEEVEEPEEGILDGITRKLAIHTMVSELRFVEGKRWTCDSTIEAIQWLNWRIICVLTATHIEIVDTQIWQRTGMERIDFRSIVNLNISRQVSDQPPSEEARTRVREGGTGSSAASVVGSFRAYKGKIFLLTTHDLRLGMVVSWADQILGLVHSGALTEAIELTTSYWQGRAELETIGLPSELVARQAIVGPKLKEIMQASVEYVFSETRMVDETHFDPLGRGVDRTELFESLVRSCARACIAMDDLGFLFEVVFERYYQNSIQSIFLDQIAGFVLSSEITSMPTAIVQQLVGQYEARGSFGSLEALVCRLEPGCLDLEQVLAICSREGLYDGLVYVYTEAMGDFVGPVVESLQLIRSLVHERESGAEDGDSAADPASTGAREARAYKLYAYLTHTLLGRAYPSKKPYEPALASRARASVYHFLFSGHTLRWPLPTGKLVTTTVDDLEPTYPYLRLLLKFDPEALLDSLDCAFEDGWLDDQPGGRDRQSIVNILLDILSSEDQEDQTFLHIFVARNLPKYAQFLSFSPATLMDILRSLAAVEGEQTTLADRELAVEFLLSVFSPAAELGPEAEEELLIVFSTAGFWGVLRSIYVAKGEWGKVAEVCVKGSEGLEVFGALPEIIQAAMEDEKMAREVDKVLVESAQTLVQASVTLTASLIDTLRPGLHRRMLEVLEELESVQFSYLHTLLGSDSRPPSKHLDQEAKLRYVTLLCKREPSAVIGFLRRTSVEASEVLLETLEGPGLEQALVWTLAQAGSTDRALVELRQAIKSTSNSSDLEQLAQVGIEICAQTTDVEAWAELLSALLSANLQIPIDIVPRLVSCLTVPASELVRRLPAAPRSLVLEIIDAHAFEASVLELALRLVDNDTFEHSALLHRGRQRGTRPARHPAICVCCGRPLLGAGAGVQIHQEEEVIERLGVPLRAVGRRKSLKGKEVEPEPAPSEEERPLSAASVGGGFGAREEEQRRRKERGLSVDGGGAPGVGVGVRWQGGGGSGGGVVVGATGWIAHEACFGMWKASEEDSLVDV
ncbi:hypothetical protein CROQUDRAFT_99492 [Cronartium quercuum f. sp. fusiforme G11]|uniref:Vacuolar protein sorting-associated protein 8 central domain-containing protein n=1 Tax=Cronartium quercuum f. sp. fusiforme G11 TaxID=708437 RepID=A0A9P6N6X7_9BASI|nr:hypothetical protein CROQUDRAFT_99492 [Cronartium quercuum f. sp. fusiforme G11]